MRRSFQKGCHKTKTHATTHTIKYSQRKQNKTCQIIQGNRRPEKTRCKTEAGDHPMALSMIHKKPCTNHCSFFFFDSVQHMMRGVTKSLSFNARHSKKHRLSSKQEDDEMNIFGSDSVSTEYLLDRFKDVKHNSRIIKLEVEDLLIASIHHSFLPMFKALVVSDKRKWKYARFIDSIDSDDFAWWESMIHSMMREYETTVEEKSTYVDVVSFKATVDVAKGTSKKSLSTLFRTILRDEDVQSVSFAGSLFGHSQESAPQEISGLFDANGNLEGGLVVNLCCGWKPPNEDVSEWKGLLKSCMSSLKKKASQEEQERSTRSERISRSQRGSRSPMPVRSIPRRQGSKSNIVLPGTRRCMTALPSTTSTRHHVRSLPQRSKSFRVARPSPGSLSVRVNSSVDEPSSHLNAAWSGERKLPARSKSLGARVLPKRSKSFKVRRSSPNDDDDMSIMEIVQDLKQEPARPPLVRSPSIMEIVHDLKQEDTRSTTAKEAKDELRSESLHPPVRRGLERKSSSKRKVRRAKSMNMNSQGVVELPDYDWSKGADHHEDKKCPIASRAA